MAKNKIPDPLTRRHLIERSLTAEQALAIAEAYLAEERAEESVVFLQKADATERLHELLEQSVEVGNVFLIQEITRALGAEAPTIDWERVVERARAAGKELYAETAGRQAHRSDD